MIKLVINPHIWRSRWLTRNRRLKKKKTDNYSHQLILEGSSKALSRVPCTTLFPAWWFGGYWGRRCQHTTTSQARRKLLWLKVVCCDRRTCDWIASFITPAVVILRERKSAKVPRGRGRGVRGPGNRNKVEEMGLKWAWYWPVEWTSWSWCDISHTRSTHSASRRFVVGFSWIRLISKLISKLISFVI